MAIADVELTVEVLTVEVPAAIRPQLCERARKTSYSPQQVIPLPTFATSYDLAHTTFLA
jgi:photosystem II stability/assembly factor-like uncharacterized protein